MFQLLLEMLVYLDLYYSALLFPSLYLGAHCIFWGVVLYSLCKEDVKSIFKDNCVLTISYDSMIDGLCS